MHNNDYVFFQNFFKTAFTETVSFSSHETCSTHTALNQVKILRRSYHSKLPVYEYRHDKMGTYNLQVNFVRTVQARPNLE